MSSHDKVESYEDLRRKNLEDNKAALATLMSEVKGHLPVKPVSPPRKRKSNHHFNSLFEQPIRRNPSRNARHTAIDFDLPGTRPRSGSVSSSVSSASSSSMSTPVSTPEKLVVRFGFFRKLSNSLLKDNVDIDRDEKEDDEDYSLLQQTRKARTRHEVKLVKDVSQADLEMVAIVVSDKKYDSIYGTTCHQCRQKTNDTKTVCRAEDCLGVRGQFCGPCLRNRYGEDARAALLDPNWMCPPCRGICNCSFCRRKKGRSSTGIMIHVAREHGYQDVNSFLQKFTKEAPH